VRAEPGEEADGAVAGAPRARVGSGAPIRWAAPVFLGALLVAVAFGNGWLRAATYRLYLEKSAAQPGSARQRFVIDAGRVQPQVVATSNETLVFPWGHPGNAELLYGAVGAAPATVQVAAIQHGMRWVLARHPVAPGSTNTVRVPEGTTAIELSNHGAVTWLDPRVVREAPLWPPGAGILTIAGATIVARRCYRSHRRPVIVALAAAVSMALAAGVLEAGLRALSPRLPWLAAVRRDLGEVQPDPRWQDGDGLGARLRPSLRTFCEWRHGDIVRMGFLPPELAPQGRLRFPLTTDPDGFRNPEGAGTEAVAALGDSFTDALTVPVERAWPARLQAELGLPVRNYGTAGFGPLQELEVLRRHVLPRRPRLAVLAFFAGNDLVDAELFDARRRGLEAPPLPPGWPIKDVVARFDELYTHSLFSGVARALREPRLPRVEERDAGDGAHPDVYTLPEAGPAFDRGLFTVPAGGTRLRFALLPPYLNVLRFTRRELEARRGWTLTRGAVLEMDQLLRGRGGELVVMYVPSKSQVYLPLIAAALPPAEREAALRHLVPANPPAFAAVYRHRGALAELLAELCAAEGIAFLDVTPALEAVVRGGRNAYFPDDSHWNTAGHAVAARELAAFLRGRGLAAAR
jgi:hypothetical protein